MTLKIFNPYANNAIAARELKLLNINDIERFYTKFIKVSYDMCWPWLGTMRNAYGIFSVGGIKLGAHRISYALEHIVIPDKLEVLHTCDNGYCVNFKHLFLGTQLDNMQDKVQKGRSPKGEKHYRMKITDQQVVQLKELYNSGIYLQKELAILFNLSQQHTSDILNNKYR